MSTASKGPTFVEQRSSVWSGRSKIYPETHFPTTLPTFSFKQDSTLPTRTTLPWANMPSMSSGCLAHGVSWRQEWVDGHCTSLDCAACAWHYSSWVSWVSCQKLIDPRRAWLPECSCSSGRSFSNVRLVPLPIPSWQSCRPVDSRSKRWFWVEISTMSWRSSVMSSPRICSTRKRGIGEIMPVSFGVQAASSASSIVTLGSQNRRVSLFGG